MNHGIILHGNLPIDHIYVMDNYPKENTNNSSSWYKCRPGGIANVAAACKKLNNTLPVFVHATLGIDWSANVIRSWLAEKEIKYKFNYASHKHTSIASIIVTKNPISKTSVVNWEACKFVYPYDVAKLGKQYIWNHFAYIDLFDGFSCYELVPQLRELRKAGCMITADLAGVPLSYDWSLFDYLFVAAEDEHKYNLFPKSYVIHEPNGIRLSWDSRDVKISPNRNIIDCVGAGDMLAASVINLMLEKKRQIEYEDLEIVYKQTEKLLLEQQ